MSVTLTTPEFYTDLCATAVATGGYTSGSGVLNVTSTALPFSQTNQFHFTIIDQSTLLPKAIGKVTTLNSGTQWSVSMSLDASANAGDIVIIALGQGAMDQIRADISQAGAYSTLPTVAKKGDRFLANDGSPFEFFYDGAVWVPYAFNHKCTPLPAGGFVGTTSFIHTYTNLGGVTRFVWDGGSGTGDAFWIPTTGNIPGSGDFRARFFHRKTSHPGTSNSSSARVGIVLYDSGSGKAISWDNAGQTSTFRYWNSITGTPSLDLNKTDTGDNNWNIGFSGATGPIWLGLLFLGSNVFLESSSDGIIWPAYNSFSATDFLPARPTHVGLYLADHTGLVTGTEILSLEVETGTSPTNYWEPFS